MSRTRVEEHPATPRSLWLVLVTLGVVFLVFNALLPAARSGNLFSEQNLLYLALIFYGAATVLYLGFAVSGSENFVGFTSLATWLGFVANTLAVGHRWYVAGRPPFSNIYEMLLVFTWTLAGLTLLVERRYGVRAIGTVTMPLAVLGVVLMQLLPSAVRPLVPALQSTWLHVHVTLAMLAYAACAVSFALAVMFLVQHQVMTETFLAATSALLTLIYGGLATRVDASGGLRVVAWDPTEGREVFLAERTPLIVVIPGLGEVFLITLVAVLVPLALYLWALWRDNEPSRVWAKRTFRIATFFQGLALAVFVLRARDGVYPSPQVGGLFATRLSASPFLLAGVVAGLLASLLTLMLDWRRQSLERILPSAETLDRLTYKTIGIAFPLLTLMIAAGAYWANRTWGSYWSWDPKETGALITWLVYAGYLHMRVARGWRGRRAAYFAILGFAVVLFTFFGVTYLLPGLHAYG